MKRLSLATVILILSVVAAFGAVRNFGKFTLDIPQGWSVDTDDSEPGVYSVILEKKDGSSFVSVVYGSTDGRSLEYWLDEWISSEESASKPKRTSDGYYVYTYKNGEGKKTTCYIRGEAGGTMYFSVEMIGSDVETMTEIRDSFTLKNSPKKSAALNSETSDSDEEYDDGDDDEPKAYEEKRLFNDNTELILAASKGDVGKVNDLLEAGANVDAQNKYGMTALMYASEGNHAEIVDALLEADADIDAKNGEGSTALMIAVIHGHEDIVSILLEAGANAKIKNDSGKRAIDYARENGKFKGSRIIKRLEKRSK